MKLLLTSNGICNPTIETAFRSMLASPTQESRAVFVPTAANGVSEDKSWLVEDMKRTCALGWERFDVVDLAAVASLDRDYWWECFELSDTLIFSGGNPFYLSYWLKASGLADHFDRLLETKVYVGASSGSIVTGSTMGAVDMRIPEYGIAGVVGQSSDNTLRWFDGCFRAHYGDDYWPGMDDDSLQETANRTGTLTYALDDNSAVSVVDGDIEIVSEGKHRVFLPNS